MTLWWRERTLHARLALLVAGAVAAAVLVVSAGAWFTVREIQQDKVAAELASDASTIAANPAYWLAMEGKREASGYRHGKEIGPCWQIIDASGTVVGGTATPLPVTDAAVAVAAGSSEPVREEVTLGPGEYLMFTKPLPGGGAVQVALDRRPDDRVLMTFALLLAVGCAAGIGGAALLGRTVSRAGLAPVDRLTGAVEDVAVTMDLSRWAQARPIEVAGNDEIARLGRSVNTMLSTLDASRRAQRALVEDAGHELRTPLTSIRTNVELLLTVERNPELAHRLTTEDRTSLLEDLDAQVRELATLTTELVELSREEASREAVEPLDLAEVVTAAVSRVQLRAPALTFDTALTPATVLGRPGELERMVVNVLDNAAKWSPPAGKVQVRLIPDGPGACLLTVTDTGPGIADEDRPHVFDRFYRSAAARAMPGSGLGLAIVAQTATNHGGTVQALPNSPTGTILTIRLPGTPA
ncbi:putative two-component system sensor kinase [Actinoplanes missouriensis 431]|uniref:Signal transduction histidine-protein kinase/phosphatase MprB n=1 Tax=Actinoplanes missouriensis (strain ATCC 14538 / DSM 43046 / CBS 188.64 / JCM 3121 / NBRC 102363 / NCIMB 12654 / NRRL B-3342 / UNCC 431) TaxID=512565 RepID=I0HBY2_ACTM4|nr:HAMP domain-containing sensor histidine kinase [Actinoplanes missouriensis]BAL90519.1 putative two-component system sensor kinase [Actinoplanes missouriensis 431]